MRITANKRILCMVLSAALTLALIAPALADTLEVQAVPATQQGITSLDFESGDAMDALEHINLGSTAPTTPASIEAYGGSNVLNPGVLGTNAYTYITTVKDSQLPPMPIRSFTFDLSMSENPGNSDWASAFYALYLDDGTSKSAAGLKVVCWSGQYFFRNQVVGTDITTTLAGGNHAGWYFNLTEKLTITVNYDYSDFANGNIGVDYVIVSDAKDSKDNFKTETVSTVYTIADYTGTFPYPVLKPAIANSVGNIRGYYDNLRFTYLDTADGKANAWYVTHQEILSKTSSTYNPLTDSAAWNAAFDDYKSLDADTQSVLLKAGVMTRFLAINGTTSSAEVLQYQTAHAQALALTTATATNAHVIIVNNAIAAYEALSDVAKICLSDSYFTLLDVQYYLKSYIPPRTDEYDKTPMYFDFNNGRNHFQNITADDQIVSELAVDPEDENNYAWRVDKFYSSSFFLDDEFWPSLCMPQTVSFRVYMKSINPFARFSVYLSYLDEENYSTVQFENNVGFAYKVVDGVSQMRHLWIINDGSFDMYAGWTTITIKFAADGTATVSAVDANEGTAMGTALFVPGGEFGFRLCGSYNLVGRETYIDDVSIRFQDGDFDLNDAVGKINVFYTGNSFVKPNETLFLSGDKLGKTVDKAYIMRLDNLSHPALGYVAQSAWDRDGMALFDGNYAVDPAGLWNASRAQEMEIVQRSDQSLNMIIPKNIGQGVYLVKLTALIPGNSDAYVLVNAPSLTFASGDQGNITTPGGTLRFVGYNLNPSYTQGALTNATVILKNLTTGALTTVTDVTGFGDNSAVEINIPSNMAKGKYAAYVHTGYGDKNAWSIPVEITVGDDPRDSWPDTVFNVRDFGAKGDGNTNDTPAFMAALQKAYEMGGGVVYVPQGSYRVLSTLSIPKNVHLMGEDNGNTMIFWTARRWALNELPSAHIRVLGDCEISNLYFYGTRFNCFVAEEKSSQGNIYFHDCRFFFCWYAGAPTNGGCTNTTGEMNYTEIRQMLIGEMKGEQLRFFKVGNKNSTNIQLQNLEIDTPQHTSRPIGIAASYWKIQNVTGMQNWLGAGGYAGIIEDCELRATIGPDANGLYYARNKNVGTGGNNKELMTTDGSPFVFQKSIQFVGDDLELMQSLGFSTTDKLTYKFVGVTPADDQYLNHNVSITSGQGLGQVRRIVWQKGVYFQVDSAFAVQPNRNGTISVTRPRMDMQFINSTWKCGDAVGTYGTMFSGLFDGNHFSDFGTQVFDNHEGPVWYITNINSVYTDPVYVHGDGAGITLHEDDIYSIALIFGGSENFGNMGFVFRNNTMDGYWFRLSAGTNENSLEGLIIEGNTLKRIGNNKPAFQLNLAERLYNNILLRNNQYDVEYVYNNTALAALNTATNKFGSLKITDDYTMGTSILENMGDVNRDGRVSMADHDLVIKYLSGSATLSDEQIKYADVNKDGKVDLKDAAQIRKFVVENIPFQNASGDIEADY